MTANEVYEKLMHFIDNDFTHHIEQQDKDVSGLRKILFGLLISFISGLLAIVGGLLFLILK